MEISPATLQHAVKGLRASSPGDTGDRTESERPQQKHIGMVTLTAACVIHDRRQTNDRSRNYGSGLNARPLTETGKYTHGIACHVL